MTAIDIREVVASRITERRKAKKWSVRKLHEVVGDAVGVDTLYLTCRGETTPTITTLIAIADALECTVDDLVREPSAPDAKRRAS